MKTWIQTCPGDMKYINHSTEGFIVWGHLGHAELSHKDVADLVLSRLGGSIRSAGFVMMFDDGPYCEGESMSLGIHSEPGDTEALKKQWGIE